MLIHPTAISNVEFLHMLKRCSPPHGWPNILAVANSGGPDSTCLLFLLKRALSHRPDSENALLSLAVDHQLQPCSARMAQTAAQNARALGVPHHTLPIHWSTPPFPSIAAAGGNIEKKARDARYHVLFGAMTRLRAHGLAFAHHADDQVEIALMRMARGSTEVGAAGMRYCRRWGMGHAESSDDVAWAGHQGMSRWIIRPLLGVGKDRILATCEENQLEYATDPTNFQPDLTQRNFVRHILAGNYDVPPARAEAYDAIREGARKLGVDVIGDQTSRARLHAVVEVLSEQRDETDRRVTALLEKCALQSPPSSLLLDSAPLAALSSPSDRSALILRVLRYVSPRPWGSVHAEAHRAAPSLARISTHLFGGGGGRFSAGSEVLWAPVAITRRGQPRARAPKEREGERAGWMVVRAPPERVRAAEMSVRIGAEVREALEGGGRKIAVMWDNRFLVEVRFGEMDEEMKEGLRKSLAEGGRGEVVIEPVPGDLRYWLPRVVWKKSATDHVVLGDVWVKPWSKKGDYHGVTVKCIRELSGIII